MFFMGRKLTSVP